MKFGAQPELFTSIGPRAPWTVSAGTASCRTPRRPTAEGGRGDASCVPTTGTSTSASRIYIDAEVLATPDLDYDRLLTSLRFDADAAAP